MEVVLAVGVFTGVISAFIANKRNRNPFVWAVVGFMFGLLSLPILLMLPSLRRCPSCGKYNNSDMKNCGYCGKSML